jgi:hypothetical protein
MVDNRAYVDIVFFLKMTCIISRISAYFIRNTFYTGKATNYPLSYILIHFNKLGLYIYIYNHAQGIQVSFLDLQTNVYIVLFLYKDVH